MQIPELTYNTFTHKHTHMQTHTHRQTEIYFLFTFSNVTSAKFVALCFNWHHINTKPKPKPQLKFDHFLFAPAAKNGKKQQRETHLPYMVHLRHWSDRIEMFSPDVESLLHSIFCPTQCWSNNERCVNSTDCSVSRNANHLQVWSDFMLYCLYWELLRRVCKSVPNHWRTFHIFDSILERDCFLWKI